MRMPWAPSPCARPAGAPWSPSPRDPPASARRGPPRRRRAGSRARRPRPRRRCRASARRHVAADGQPDIGERLRPAAPHAHLPDLDHPRHAHRAAGRASRSEAGTPSSSAITVRLPSWRLTQMTMPATPRAATASAFASHGMPSRPRPRRAPGRR